jgi:hypothetical protein
MRTTDLKTEYALDRQRTAKKRNKKSKNAVAKVKKPVKRLKSIANARDGNERRAGKFRPPYRRTAVLFLFAACLVEDGMAWDCHCCVVITVLTVEV